MKKVKGTITQNTIVSQLAEFSSGIVSVLLFLTFGAKKSFTFMYTLSILGAFLLLIFPNDLVMIPLYITIAKFGISAAFNLVYLSAVSLIPTILSSTVFGFCNVPARVITIMAPVVAEQDAPAPMLVCLVLVSCAIVASQFVVEKLPKFA